MMHLKPHIAELVQVFRESESAIRRGPYFKGVALALEEEMKRQGLSAETLLDCFGPPDLFDGDAVYVYFFDHKKPGRNRDEWYFHLDQGIVVSSGYNRRGINDLSRMRDRSQFPARDAAKK